MEQRHCAIVCVDSRNTLQCAPLAPRGKGLAIDDQLIDILFWAVLAGIVAVRLLAWEQLKGLRANGWPTVQGTIESGNVAKYHTRYGNYYIAQLAYSYTVNAEYYSGYYKKTFFRESSADRFVAKLKGQMAFVRHKPDSPERSALLKQDQMGGWPT
jgi:Protein of unknown function (DUF3592)